MKKEEELYENKYKSGKMVNPTDWSLASFGSIAIFLNPIDSFKSFTLVLGYLTLFMGITKTLRYFTSSVFTSELPLFKGIINIVFGLIIIFNTELTLVTVLFLIGYWIFVDSVLEIIDAFRYRKMRVEYWWLSLVNGIIGTILGFLMIGDLNLSTFYLTLVISFKLLSTGINMIMLFFIITKYYRQFEKFDHNL